MVADGSANSIRDGSVALQIIDEVPSSAPSAPFSIDSAKVVEDTLQLKLSYGGGRKDHVLEAFRALVFLEDDPPTTEILIAHDTTNDSCEAMVWQKQAIDLMPLRKAFQSVEPHDDTLTVDAFEVSVTLITGVQNVVNI